MSDKLKDFISQHKCEFDTNEPGEELWEKIDTQLEMKSFGSKWLSKLMYIGFSTSILILAVYFITKKFDSASSDNTAWQNGDSVKMNSYSDNRDVKTKSEPNTKENITEPTTIYLNENKKIEKNVSNASTILNQDSALEKKQELNVSSFETNATDLKKTTSVNEKKESTISKNKKSDIYIPENPDKMNTYTGTIYENSAFCSLLRVYKFPGKVRDGGHSGPRIRKNFGTKGSIEITSCSHLENTLNLKAVWIKGKSDKEFKLTVKKGFKNIILVKSDGRKIYPEAISHYFGGRGVITGFTEKINMQFKEKVEFILFFKDAEAGDKILIDKIEAIIKNKP